MNILLNIAISIALSMLVTMSAYADREQAIQAELDRLENVECAMNTKIGKVLDWKIFTDKEEDQAIKFSKEQNQVMYIRHDVLNNTIGYAVPYYATAVVSKDFKCQ